MNDLESVTGSLLSIGHSNISLLKRDVRLNRNKRYWPNA